MRALVAAVLLGGLFGIASADVDSISDGVMIVDIEVEIVGSADTVVAHLVFGEEAELTLPLLDRGEGIFGIRTELEAKNYAVVFEVVGEGSSEPVLLSQMGADLGPESGPPTTVEDDGLSAESQSLLWLAVALAAASLSALAFWVLGGGKRRDAGDGTDGAGEEE